MFNTQFKCQQYLFFILTVKNPKTSSFYPSWAALNVKLRSPSDCILLSGSNIVLLSRYRIHLQGGPSDLWWPLLKMLAIIWSPKWSLLHFETLWKKNVKWDLRDQVKAVQN